MFFLFLLLSFFLSFFLFSFFLSFFLSFSFFFLFFLSFFLLSFFLFSFFLSFFIKRNWKIILCVWILNATNSCSAGQDLSCLFSASCVLLLASYSSRRLLGLLFTYFGCGMYSRTTPRLLNACVTSWQATVSKQKFEYSSGPYIDHGAAGWARAPPLFGLTFKEFLSFSHCIFSACAYTWRVYMLALIFGGSIC